jgi:hypothetical protein
MPRVKGAGRVRARFGAKLLCTAPGRSLLANSIARHKRCQSEMMALSTSPIAPGVSDRAIAFVAKQKPGTDGRGRAGAAEPTVCRWTGALAAAADSDSELASPPLAGDRCNLQPPVHAFVESRAADQSLICAWRPAKRPVAQMAMSRTREPLRGQPCSAEFAVLLRRRGWEGHEPTGPSAGIRRRHQISRRDGLPLAESAFPFL